MNATDDTSLCPLCQSPGAAPFHEDRKRAYLRCVHCLLVFVPQSFWLNAEEEKATYDLHENDPLDLGYRKFLSRLSGPLLGKLNPNMQGLDFGCGPGPTLSVMLEEQGHRVDLYDPIYSNDPSVFEKSYDFICATEVVEHFREPGLEFGRLFAMLKPGGWLGIMTKLVLSQQAFRTWHYTHDMTHLCFYSENTLQYLAHRFQADCQPVAKDAILFQKK